MLSMAGLPVYGLDQSAIFTQNSRVSSSEMGRSATSGKSTDAPDPSNRAACP